jgi:hypothetical protein
MPTDMAETKLRLRLKNAKGEPVSFSKAQLFLETWSYYDTLTLTTKSDLLVLSLEKDSMPPPDYNYAQYDWEHCILYVEAKGYVPVQSKPMECIGMETGCGPSTQVAIEFPDGPAIEIRKGETGEIELRVRKPQDRYLRFVDDDQEPVPGVQVTSGIFWTNANHCAHWTVGWLGEGPSDQEGRVAIPDGDFEYALAFEKPFYHLKQNNVADPMALITYLSDEETVIELHKLQKRRLEMTVLMNGKPLVGETLWGAWIGAPCGLWEQELATTDENGRIVIEDFYPEEWIEIFLWPYDADRPVWSADPQQLSGFVEVELQE